MDEAFLEIMGPERPMTRVTLEKGKLTIGRGQTNDIVLQDEKASRLHAVVESKAGHFVVKDLNSTNGTRLNGKKLTGMFPIEDGSVIEIGRHRLTLRMGEPAAEAVEELTADDLVEVDEFAPLSLDGLEGFEEIPEESAIRPVEELAPSNVVTDDAETATQLARKAEALPRRGFGASQIELTDSRGQVIHEAGDDRKTKHEPGSAVELLRLLLLICSRSRATDIHVEPREGFHTVRLRVDGLMVDLINISSTIGVKIATLVKVMCKVDIAQRNAIQEGAFAARTPDEKHPGRHHRVDYRVSYAPALLGQKLAVRILDSGGAPARLADLGLPRKMMEDVSRVIHQESGMVLVVGPTGSGKTTTLYSLLRSIDLARRNVVTIEDPVELHLEGITQIPVDEEHDRSFLQLLKSVLRQDPDVILVGEVRDAETSRVAMQAAITGHMVFSTLHTRDTIGTIFRLRDLGVEPYMLGQALQLVIAQRLIRQLCPACKKPVAPTKKQLEAFSALGIVAKQMHLPIGCARCLGIGYSGRRAFFELLLNRDELTQAIVSNAARDEVLKVVLANGFVSLRQSAFQMVADGLVGFEEVERDIGLPG